MHGDTHGNHEMLETSMKALNSFHIRKMSAMKWFKCSGRAHTRSLCLVLSELDSKDFLASWIFQFFSTRITPSAQTSDTNAFVYNKMAIERCWHISNVFFAQVRLQNQYSQHSINPDNSEIWTSSRTLGRRIAPRHARILGPSLERTVCA